ncbi:uncharacterized protein F54H12.2 [Trichonephila inaurata madagascariensis]|uniref:Uncharacterized protein F54H12.2 n=1 Tax=Trichonephila inaurata madagascariensis TaxID=2747483 RepID=A0A8X6IK49_9ARAC|nr:uncharacterized protein F54H12.2 [Trichonephila inaurata madagascariensis]
MLVPYKCCVRQYEDYYVNQAGNGLSYYQGQSFQKSSGIGGWFKRLFRTALPFLTRGAKSVGKEVLKTGTQIANDLLEEQNLEDAAKHRAKETERKLARRADDMLGQDSPECAKSELNLFTLPPTQTVIEKGQWIQFHPIANDTDGGPVEFLISGSGEDYLDLSQTQLCVKAKVLTDDDKIGPVNHFLHSLFSQVDVSLNGRNVSSTNNTYPYRTILETILNHGYDSKLLTSEIYYKDIAGRINIFDDDKEPNEGFNKRASLFKKSVTVDMIGRLDVDLFNQDRLLLNLVELKIKLIRNAKPKHNKCRSGKLSWCFYKGALANEPVEPDELARENGYFLQHRAVFK